MRTSRPLVAVLLVAHAALLGCAQGRAGEGDARPSSGRDAGPSAPDAFVASIDAAPLDAWVPEGVDASFPDAFYPDAAYPDAFYPDAFTPDAPTRPTFSVRFLANGGTSWVPIALTADAPSGPIEAAMGVGGTSDILLLTHTELFVFNTISHAISGRRSRDSVFPEVSGVRLGDGYSVGDATGGSINVTLMARNADTWVYGWNHAARTATFDRFVAGVDLGDDWHGPLAPPTYEQYGIVFIPDNTAGWATADPARSPCDRTPITQYAVVFGWDGFGPRGMTTSIWDAGCFLFVNKGTFGSSVYPPFAMTGAPADPFTIDAIAWSSGLWLFTHG